MQVALIPQEEIDSDLGVVNAARVSLGKKTEWQYECNNLILHLKTVLCSYCKPKLSSKDIKLLNYLACHNHWTPFAHSSFYLDITWGSVYEEVEWYKNRNSAGFQHIEMYSGKICSDSYCGIIKGSLIGWIRNIKYLPPNTQKYLLYELYKNYPESTNALCENKEYEPFNYETRGIELNPEYIKLNFPDIYSVTLYIKCPIAIARQVRTSQVGFSYSDYYVEGESFVYNEVSRRYVNDDPEFYEIAQWRTRKGSNIKQGSNGIATDYVQREAGRVEIGSMGQGLADYRYLDIKYNIAPEQLRFLLPQSMYTEFYMTGTLSRWCQWLALRSSAEVQLETRYLAAQVALCLAQAHPEYMDKADIKIAV